MGSESGAKRFEKIVSMSPVEWETALSYALQFVMHRQDPEEVTFKRYKNGWAIEVKTDEENAEDMAEFWKDHVETNL